MSQVYADVLYIHLFSQHLLSIYCMPGTVLNYLR